MSLTSVASISSFRLTRFVAAILNTSVQKQDPRCKQSARGLLTNRGTRILRPEMAVWQEISGLFQPLFEDRVVGDGGFEPPTSTMSTWRSTPELIALFPDCYFTPSAFVGYPHPLKKRTKRSLLRRHWLPLN